MATFSVATVAARRAKRSMAKLEKTCAAHSAMMILFVLFGVFSRLHSRSHYLTIHLGGLDSLKPTYVPELIPIRPRSVALKSGIVKSLQTDETKTSPRMIVHAII